MNELIKSFEELKNSKNEDELLDCCYNIKKTLTNNINSYKLLLTKEIEPYLKIALSGSSEVHTEVALVTIKMLNMAIKKNPEITIQHFNEIGILQLVFNQITSDSISISQAVIDLFTTIISNKKYNKPILLNDYEKSDWFNETFKKLVLEYSLANSNKIIFFRILVIGSLLLNLNLNLEELNTNNSLGVGVPQIETFKPNHSIGNNSIDPSIINSNTKSISKEEEEYNEQVFKKYREPFITILVQAFNDSTGKDQITQMNILEIIEESCKYTVALQSIINSGMINSLYEILKKTINDDDDGDSGSDISSAESPILNKIISFLANVSQLSNEKTEMLFFSNGEFGKKFIEIFKYHLNHSENELSRKLKMTILASIGIIGKNSKGLDLIIKDESFIRSYTEFFLSNDQETIVTSYNSFAIMLKSNDKIYLVSDKLYQIYRSLPDGLLMSKMTKNYSSPIEEIKTSSFSLIQALCVHSWGASEVIKMAGFFEYLMNRQNESTKLAKEWKFCIIQTLVNQHKDLFTSSSEWRDRYHQMESYLKKGIHFIPYESITKIENEFQG
ncbi:hypothetical protein ACTFIZ_007856 [Dictyostelium cf. discoideum]